MHEAVVINRRVAAVFRNIWATFYPTEELGPIGLGPIAWKIEVHAMMPLSVCAEGCQEFPTHSQSDRGHIKGTIYLDYKMSPAVHECGQYPSQEYGPRLDFHSNAPADV